jgi:hypothetical protein
VTSLLHEGCKVQPFCFWQAKGVEASKPGGHSRAKNKMPDKSTSCPPRLPPPARYPLGQRAIAPTMPNSPMLVAALLSLTPAGAVTSNKDALDPRLQKGSGVGGPATAYGRGHSSAATKIGSGHSLAYTTMMKWWCEKPEHVETQECVRSKLYQQLREKVNQESRSILLDRLKNVSHASKPLRSVIEQCSCGSWAEGRVRSNWELGPLHRCLPSPFSQRRDASVPLPSDYGHTQHTTLTRQQSTRMRRRQSLIAADMSPNARPPSARTTNDARFSAPSLLHHLRSVPCRSDRLGHLPRFPCVRVRVHLLPPNWLSPYYWTLWGFRGGQGGRGLGRGDGGGGAGGVCQQWVGGGGGGGAMGACAGGAGVGGGGGRGRGRGRVGGGWGGGGR